MQTFDLVVIGGGSAGLKAARTAARMGKSVAVAEEKELGGECFWAGCVPTKAMVRAAQIWHQVRHSEPFGIHADICKADFAEAMAYKDRAAHCVGGDGPADGGLSRLGVAYFPTHAAFESSREIRVGKEVIRGEQILLATGTVPFVPPIPGLAEAGYLTNREIVHLETLPKHLVILGGGPIGLEFAQTFRRFGAEVTVVEWKPQILATEDEEIADLAAVYLREEGIRLLTDTVATGAGREGGRKFVRVQRRGQAEEEIFCDEILAATGRSAAVGSLNIEAAGLALEGRYLPTDAYQRTAAPHIWATGDLTGGYLFTHVANYEGKIAALNICSETPQPLDERVVPRCTFLAPEVASLGLTEKQAREQEEPIAVHAFDFADLDRAILHNETRGLVKIIVNATSGRILGAHLIGHEASSLLGELAVCMKNDIPLAGIADTMHAYPSFPEAIEAAALSPPRSS